MATTEELLRPSQAAALLHVTVDTLRGYAQAGELSPVRTPGGHRRYPLADVRAFIERRAT